MDVGAHLSGFAFGILFGVLYGKFGDRLNFGAVPPILLGLECSGDTCRDVGARANRPGPLDADPIASTSTTKKAAPAIAPKRA